MYTLLKPLPVREDLLRKGVRIFTSLEFERIFRTSKLQTKYFLEEQSKAGLFERLKKGLYGLKTDLPIEEEIANRLYQPSYISFEYALAKYNILPEMVYQVTSATSKPTRTFTIGEKVFSYFTIKEAAYTGYAFVKQENGAFLIAEPEKALVDYLYFVALGKKPHNDRLNLTKLNRKKLLSYARFYSREKLNKLLDELL